MKNLKKHDLSLLSLPRRLAAILLFCAAMTVAASPWDSWRMAYTSFEKGEKLRDSGDYVNALSAFNDALKHYQSVRVARPDWNQRVISDRIAECERERSKIQTLLGKAAIPAKKIEQGSRQMASVSSEVTLLKRQLAERSAELRKVQASAEREKRLEAEIANLIRDQRQSAEKLALLKRQLESRDKESGLPSALAQKLKKRLEEEKVRTETLSRKAEELSSNLKSKEGELRSLSLAKNAVDLELKRTREELASRNAELKKATDAQTASGKEARKTENPSTAPSSAAAPENLNKLAELEASLQRVSSARNAVEKENLTMRASLEQAEKKQQESEKALAREQEFRAKLEQDFRVLSKRNKELVNRLDERTGKDFADMTAAKERIDRLNAELDQLQVSLLNWKHQAEALTLEKKQLTADLNSARAAEKKASQELQKTSEELQKTAAAADQLRDLPAKYQQLEKNFLALQAENKENRLLAEAAKPREAELANIKLRLAELNRLKGDLAAEQRLNGELQVTLRKREKQLAHAKEYESQLLTLKRDLPEIETLRQELARSRKLNEELASVKQTEGDISALKLKLANAEARAADRDRLQKINSELLAMQKAQRAELTALEERNLNQKLKNLNAEKEAEKAEKTKNTNLLLKEENARLKTALVQQERLTADAQHSADREKARGETAEKELVQLRKINAELASAKKLEGEVAKLRLQIADAESLRSEIKRLEKLCRELTSDRESLEKELNESRNSPVVGISIVPVPVKENPDDLVASGLLAEKDGNLELAIWNYRQALQANREHTAAAKHLGRIRYLRREYRDALPLLSVARTAAPKDAELGYMAASSAIALRRFGNARSILDPLVKIHPDHWKLQTALALVEQGSGDNAGAEKRLQFALRLAPEQTVPRIELARLIVSSDPGRREEAARIYEAARTIGAAPDLELERQLADVLDKRRDSASFLSSAAGEAESAGDWKSAVWYYRQLQELGWKPETTIPKLAFARFKEKNSAAALEVLQFAKGGKDSALAGIVTMLIRYRAGNLREAVEAARRAVSANGGAPVDIPVDCGALNAELLSAFKNVRTPEEKTCREAFREI